MLPAGEPLSPQLRCGSSNGDSGRLLIVRMLLLTEFRSCGGRSSTCQKMSYSSQVTSVRPIQIGLISNSFSLPSLFLRMILPGGNCTRVNLTLGTVTSILSVVVLSAGLSSAEQMPAAI